MLENLRQIIDEDNRIENINELMVEATDSAIMDIFIDEDGEAEIPESELNKILSKIPEYNQEEELNKKLKRITESYIPDYDELNTLEEDIGKNILNLIDKYNRIMDDIRASNAKSAALGVGIVAAQYTLAAGIPGLIIGTTIAAPGAAMGSIVGSKLSNILPKQITKIYTKGKPITKDLILGLLDACQTKKDLTKFTLWLSVVYKSLANVSKNSPEVQEDLNGFRDWIRYDIKHKALPAKRDVILAMQKAVKESYDTVDDYDYDYKNMSYDEFCETMNNEVEEYQNALEENIDDMDFSDDILEESKESREAKFDARMEKIYRKQASTITDMQELEVTLRKNKALYKQITSAIKTKEAKIDDSTIKRLLGEFKDRILFMRFDPLNPGENTPLSILKRNLRNNKICEKVLKERIRELKKSNKKATKESMSFYETAQSIVDDIF